MTCPFCNEVSNRIIVENELAFAFLTNIPITPGHVLVSPKRCISKIDELDNKESIHILNLVKKMKTVLKKEFNATGFNVAWNEGKTAGQTVNHLHIHVVPRKENDSGIYEYEPRKFLYRPGSRNETPEEELSDITKKLKNYF